MNQTEFDYRWRNAAAQLREMLGLRPVRLVRIHRLRIRWYGRVIFERTWRTVL